MISSVRKLFALAFGVLLLALGSGCATIRVTDPYSTATEQFLESEASRQAIARIDVNLMRDRKVYVDPSFLTGSTQTSPGNLVATQPPSPVFLFVLGEIRSRLLTNGVRLVDKPDLAEIILEVRTGGIGIDRTEFLLGLPGLSLSFNVTANIPVTTPELAILKSTKQDGFASVDYIAYWRTSGEVVSSSVPFVGRTFRHDFWILGTGPNTVGNIAPATKAVPTTQGSK